MDKWNWTRQTIQAYRQQHEPYNSFEKMMLEHFKDNPFTLSIWRKPFSKTKICSECGQGEILRSEEPLPSGLVVMTKRCSNSNCSFFEKVVLTDEDEVLDYERKPEMKTGGRQRKITREAIERAEDFMRKGGFKRRGRMS